MLKHACTLVSSKLGELYQHTRSRVTRSQQTHTHTDIKDMYTNTWCKGREFATRKQKWTIFLYL